MSLYTNGNNFPSNQTLMVGTTEITKVYCGSTLVWEKIINLVAPVLVSTSVGTTGKTNVTIKNNNDVAVTCHYGSTSGSSLDSITISANSSGTFSGSSGAPNGYNAYYWFTATNANQSPSLYVTALSAPTTAHDSDSTCDIKIGNSNSVSVTVYYGTDSYSTASNITRTANQEAWQTVSAWNTDYYFWCFASGYIGSKTTVGNAGHGPGAPLEAPILGLNSSNMTGATIYVTNSNDRTVTATIYWEFLDGEGNPINNGTTTKSISENGTATVGVSNSDSTHNLGLYVKATFSASGKTDVSSSYTFRLGAGSQGDIPGTGGEEETSTG